jgi:hypothetical protein
MHPFIECPNCRRQVPSGFQVCQFCQASLLNVPRQYAPPPPGASVYNVVTHVRPPWAKFLYVFIAWYFIITSVIVFVWCGVEMSQGSSKNYTYAFAVNFLEMLLGAGLLARIPSIRGLVVVLSLLGILGALAGVLGDFRSLGVSGFKGVYNLIQSICDLCFYGLLIYVIGETD